MSEGHGISWEQWLRGRDLLSLFLASPSLTAEALKLRWEPGDADRKAAWLLLLELGSRVATQPLEFGTGTEDAALVSVHKLFDLYRDIAKQHFGANHFAVLVLHVLNAHVRPFTAKWHRRQVAGQLDSLDVSIEFRAELRRVQDHLRDLGRLLSEVANSPNAFFHTPSSPEDTTTLPPVVPRILGNQSEGKFVPDVVLEAELREVRIRRGINPDAEVRDLSGLALSGGGIRSATFALGVVTELARRGILAQVDYLSTVSGGGYLGAFLSTIAGVSDPTTSKASHPQSLEEVFGDDLKGETGPIRSIRNHSRFLTEGGLKTIAEIVWLVVLGIVTTGLFLAPYLLVLAVVVHKLAVSPNGAIAGSLLFALSGVVLTHLCQRFGIKAGEKVGAAIGLLGLSASVVLATTVAATSNPLVLRTASVVALLLLVVSAAISILIDSRTYWAKISRASVSALLLVAVLSGVVGLATVTDQHAIAAVLTAAALLLYASFAVDINLASPHRFYRDRLASAYLLVADSGGVRNAEPVPKLSELNSKPGAPYHLINTTQNLPTSPDRSLRGRKSDFFLFSKHYCGSLASGYQSTADWERVNTDLDLATAMAVSGAALSPNMGALGSPATRQVLAALNVRLSYWLRRPNAKSLLARPVSWFYYLRELFGRINESLAFVNVSDGGHIENLGVYELLRRQCKFVVAVDGEADPDRAFRGLLTLAQLAAIDFGIRLEPDLTYLRAGENGVGKAHFEVFRIAYPNGVLGCMLYIKASLTGNESEYLKRYQADNPAFPHESTAKQVYSERQFEAYRSLGQHIATDLFREDFIGSQEALTVEQWMHRLSVLLSRPRT